MFLSNSNLYDNHYKLKKFGGNIPKEMQIKTDISTFEI